MVIKRDLRSKYEKISYNTHSFFIKLIKKDKNKQKVSLKIKNL